MIPSSEVVSAAVQALEEDGHAKGWDQRPGLYVLVAGPARIAAVEFPVPSEVWQRDTGERLLTLARNAIYAADQAPVQFFLGMLRVPGFAGVALRNEVWARLGMSKEEEEDYRAGGARLADRPNVDGGAQTVEARQVVAIDVAGRCHWRVRVRGQEPNGLVCEWNDPGHPTGQITTALRLLVIAACEGLPADTHAIAPLAACRDRMAAEPTDFSTAAAGD